MNPFKGGCGRKCPGKRKSKCAEVEVKEEPGIKEEPNDGSLVDIAPQRFDDIYRVDYNEQNDIIYDFDKVKPEIKCEEEETCKEENSASSKRSIGSHEANDHQNDEPMGDAIDVQPPQVADNENKRNGNTQNRNQRTIPRNQMAKKQNKYKCHVCNHVAGQKCDLIRHLRTHTGEKPFKCDVCSKSFSNKHNLNRHKKTHGQFRCSKCHEGFEQESAKMDHETLCNPDRVECDICGKTMRKSHLTVHLRIHKGEKPFECSICFKRFTTNVNLRKHSIVHKDELPNACSKCGRRFATPKDQHLHETRCQRSIFACNQCHYKTVHKHSLDRHMQSKHGAKRLIECQICAKLFTEQIELNRHLSTAHSDQLPFQCSKCFGRHATEDGKGVHEGNCGYRRYQCHLCKKCRRDKRDLKVHMRKGHTGDRIQCKVCAEGFISKSGASRHMTLIHRLKKN